MIDHKTAPYGAAILRIAAGLAFLAHAALKLFVFTPSSTMHYFASLGLPGWFGLFVIVAETLAGLALILGFYARLAAILIAPDLIGAILLVHLHNGFFFNASGAGWEYPAFWAITLVVVALLGEGSWAMRPSVISNR
jgi:putative oxidoreductase